MANILDQYGIKEVADVTIYELESDGTAGDPVLYLNTLKISTIEQVAEQAQSEGGKGNSPLIIWDYGKEITVNIEDALFTPKSMHLMYGNSANALATEAAAVTITRMIYVAQGSEYAASITTKSNISAKYYTAENMTLTTVVPTGPAYVEETYVSGATGYTIEVSADKFPGTYKIVGDTVARNRMTGDDEYFQFIIPQAKMGAENTITLEAAGEPTVFNMTMRVLRPADGIMMKLIKYTIS